MKKPRLSAAALALGLAFTPPALSAGNLASRPTALELTLRSDLTMSNYEYTLETGKYYRWDITMAADGEEFAVAAPELWRNSWINEFKVGDLEIHMFGAPYQVEFDGPGLLQVWFVPIRPGDYDFYVPGHESRGMKGKFIVR